jgi:outer membrane cobalamin receptor
MRLTALVIAVFLVLPVAGQHLDELRLTVEFTDTPLREAITHLEKKFGLLFSFPSEEVDDKTVNCSFQNADWPTVNQCLFAAWDLDAIAQKEPYVSLRPTASTQERTWQLCLDVRAPDDTPLPFAPLGFPGRGQSFSTDEAGRYEGEVTVTTADLLSVQYLGYASRAFALREIIGGNCRTIYLTPKSIDLVSVLVSEYLTEGVSATADERRIDLDPGRMPAVPGFTNGEVYRSLSLLPGINNLNETAGDLSIRGGARDQNLVLWDGIPVYTAGHYFGMISNFSPELIDNVSVWRGQGNAAYGGRVSGIVSFGTDREVSEVFRAGASLDLLAASAFVKAPIIKDRSDIHLSFRTSLPGLLPGPTYQGYRAQVFQAEAFEELLEAENAGAEDFDFQEINGRWQYNFDDGHRLTVSGFRQRNDFSYLLQPAERRFIGESTTVLSSGYSTNYERPLGGGALGVQIAHTDYANAGQSGFQRGERNFVTSRRSSELRETSLRLNYTRSFANKGKLTAGVQLQRYGHQLELRYVNRLADSIRQLADPETTALAGAAYGSYEWNPTGPFSASLGLRLQYYAPTEKLYREPRVSANYRLSNHWLLKAAYGENHQFPLEIIQLNPQQVSGTLPLWTLADGDRVQVPTSREVSAGFSGQPGTWLFDLEVYHKRVENISTLNTTVRERDFTSGDSRSYGLDLLVRKRWKKLRGWVIYSLSRTDWRFPDTRKSAYFPADNDRRHQLRLMGSWQNERWSFTAGWRVHSGQRYTAPEEVELRRGQTIARLRPGPTNGAALPVFHRLDASAFYTWTPPRATNWRGNIGLSLLNIYGRENYLARQYLLRDTEQSSLNRFQSTAFDKIALGFTPNLTVRVGFR